jgi:hypothetical protein
LAGKARLDAENERRTAPEHREKEILIHAEIEKRYTEA